jgi:hypothetical protein
MEQNTIYPSPVGRFLDLGECQWGKKDWFDYSSLGITAEHIPTLIQLATDSRYLDSFSEGNEDWAPIHAWRALGQLKAVEAVETLIGLLRRIEEKDDDWILEEFPVIFQMIGKEAAPALMQHVQNRENLLFARVAALEGIINIGKTDPEFKSECIEFLRSCLKHYEEDDPGINANYIAGLTDLKDMGSLALIEEAFEAGCVDEMMMGDWEDIQIKLGLISERITPRKSYFDRYTKSPDYSNQAKAAQKRQERSRRRNRQARKAKKQNRKKR